MYFYLIGIDYKTAPISVRETFYQEKSQIADFWLYRYPGRAAMLMTCNRIEIYGAALNPDEAFRHTSDFAKSFADFFHYAYVKYGRREVLRHALRLACGLQSQLEGEAQIFQQLNNWHQKESLSGGLKELWEEVMSLSGRIRVLSGLIHNSLNLADIVCDDLSGRINLDDSTEIIVAGTGKIAELIAKNSFSPAHLNFVGHKNYARTKTLASYSGGDAFLLQQLPRLLAKADVLISATKSPHRILSKEHFVQAMKNRSQPLYVYDLAVPRDIEPSTAEVKGLYLQNLDDLGEAINRCNRGRQQNIKLAAQLAEEASLEYAGCALV